MNITASFLSTPPPPTSKDGEKKKRKKKKKKPYAMPQTTLAATPGSSALTVAFNATPDLLECAILIWATTLPPLTVLPYSFKTCVVMWTATPLLARGCRDNCFLRTSMASTSC